MYLIECALLLNKMSKKYMKALHGLLAENKKKFEESQRKAIAAEVQQQGLPTAEEVRNVVTEAI
jgi:hypothetical protein